MLLMIRVCTSTKVTFYDTEHADPKLRVVKSYREFDKTERTTSYGNINKEQYWLLKLVRKRIELLQILRRFSRRREHGEIVSDEEKEFRERLFTLYQTIENQLNDAVISMRTKKTN